MRIAVKTYNSYHRAPRTLALPLRRFAFSPLNFEVKSRLAFSMFLGAVCIVAITSYIASVNGIWFSGQAMKKSSLELKTIEKDYVNLQEILAREQSPAWLEERSKTGGMVEAGALRFIVKDQSVALSLPTQ